MNRDFDGSRRVTAGSQFSCAVTKPADTMWNLEPHSRGKHHILRRYIQAWLPIMSKTNPRIIIVDAFAGPGRYLGGEEGSPLILLNAYLKHSYRQQITSEIVYLFIEERVDRVDHLRSEIARLELPDNVKVDFQHGRYEDVFGSHVRAIRAEGHELAPTFAFVDPFGYSEASMDLTGQFLQFHSCEVLVYMPLPFVARFVTRAGQERAMTSLFGTDTWKEAGKLSGQRREIFLHDLFRDQLRSNGSRFVRSFEIQSDASHGYDLFFGTNNLLGLRRMKEAMWSLDPITGQRFADSTATGQLVLFQDRVDVDPLRAALREQFDTRPFTIEEAERFTLLDTAYVPSHLRGPILIPAEAEERLKVLSRRKRIRTYPSGTRMQFVR
jgi:three-Cys-motif partner protein